MATVVLGVVGGAIGGYFGGPWGAFAGRAIGAAAGAYIDNAIFAPKPQDVQGPRLSDLSVSTSTYGQPIALAHGERVRMGGNIIWSSGLIEAVATSGGGKGSSKKPKTTSYSYYASFAVAFCEGPVSGVKRMWGDGKLLYEDGVCTRAGHGVEVYLGTEDQYRDYTLEAYLGVGNVPGYRGICYVVFKDLALADFANRIPLVTAEIETSRVSLSQVVGSLADRVGCGTVDHASLTATVGGYALARSTTPRQGIEELMVGYACQATSTPGGVTVRPKGTHPLAGIDGGDLLGASQDSRAPADVYRVTRAEETALPREVTLSFMDLARDFQPSTVRSYRQVGASAGKVAYDLAIVMSPDDAKARVEQAHIDVWAARSTLPDLTAPPRANSILAGESLDCVVGSEWRRLSLSTVRVGANGLVEWDAVLEQPDNWTAHTATSSSGSLPANEQPQAVATTLHLLDIPILQESDDGPGFYIAPAGALGWRGAAVRRSADGVNFADLYYTNARAIAGTCSTTLGSGPADYVDDGSTVTVVLTNSGDTLESITADELLGLSNAALIGSEIVQFRTATLVAASTYTLSGLLRGRLGTDHHISTHGASERFILLTGGGIERQADGLALRGVSHSYKGVSLYQDEGAASAQTFANTCVGLMPLSPVHVSGARDGSGNLTIAWIRRTRIPSGWQDGADAPLGEDAEAYEVDVMSGSTVLRTISATSQTAPYSAAEQTTDFGSPQASVTVRVYQISASVGRGTAREATI